MDTATDITLIQLLIMITDDNNAIHVALTVGIYWEVNRWMILLLGHHRALLHRPRWYNLLHTRVLCIWLTASRTKAG